MANSKHAESLFKIFNSPELKGKVIKEKSGWSAKFNLAARLLGGNNKQPTENENIENTTSSNQIPELKK